MLDTFLHHLFLRYKLVVLATFNYGEMFAVLASLAGETIAGHCCVEERAFQAAFGHSARFARQSRVAQRSIFYKAKTCAQLCTCRSKQGSLQRWHPLYSSSTSPLCIALASSSLSTVNIMYVISHAYSTGRRTYCGFSWESKIL